MAEIAEGEKLASVISSALGEVADEDRHALGKLESLKQAIADAAAAEERAACRSLLPAIIFMGWVAGSSAGW